MTHLQWMGFLAVFLGVNFWFADVAAKMCYFGQEMDERGKLRWMMPAAEYQDRCSCTRIEIGGINPRQQKRSHDPYYTDHPMFTDELDRIRDYFNCEDSTAALKKTDQPGTAIDPTAGPPSNEHQPKGGTGKRIVDCKELYEDADNHESGLYTIYPSQYPDGLEVYCDLAQWHGYIVIQRRTDGSENFNRSWADYRDGFGNKEGEFWLGNEIVRNLTNEGEWSLLVDLVNENGHTGYMKLSPFRITGDNYTLNIGNYLIGNIGNSLRSADNQTFSTYDNDNDDNDDINCARLLGGGWWFNSCEEGSLVWYGSHRSTPYQTPSNNQLNGEYFLQWSRGMRWSLWSSWGSWDSWGDRETILIASELKITRNG